MLVCVEGGQVLEKLADVVTDHNDKPFANCIISSESTCTLAIDTL